MDNLQSVTYQTFEQDPVKYSHYEEVSHLRFWKANIYDVLLGYV